MASVKDIAKAVLKVGTKAAVPVLGDVITAAVEEAGGLLIDHDTAGRAKKFQDRLIEDMRSDLEQACHSEGTSEDQLTAVLATVQNALARHSLSVSEWTDVHFDRSDAAAKVLEQARALLTGLDGGETAQVRRILESFYGAVFRNRDLLLDTEADFRSAVLHGLDRLLALPRPPSATDREELIRGIEAAMIALPTRRWNEMLPPGALLRAEYGIVPFHGRKRETEDLQAWCDDAAPIGIRLYTGAGGMGKSRLLIEQCERLTRQGWRAGFLEWDADKEGPRLWNILLQRPGRVFVVVDYAETRRDAVVALLRWIPKKVSDCVRIVLLARAAGDWWDDLQTEGGGVGDLLMGPATRWHSIGPVALSADDRIASYRLAAERFGNVLQKPAALEPPDDLAAPHFERILLLHMMALATVEGIAVKGENGILAWMLARERGFWKSRAKERDLPRPVAKNVGEAMALFTLIGGAGTQRDALAYLAKLPSFKDQTQAIRDLVAALLHECYPGNRWIEPVQPDLLGEELVGAEASEEIFAIVFDQGDKVGDAAG
jgi:hypothetical protein